MRTENLADDLSIELIDNKLQVNMTSTSDVLSVHLWHISDYNNKNRSRIYISGWTKLKAISIEISKPGNYYVQMFNKDTGKSITSKPIPIKMSELLDGFDAQEVDEKYKNISRSIETSEQIMQQMFIAGGEEISYQLKKVTVDRKISLFVHDYGSARIANMIFAQDFFDNNLKIDKYLTFDRINFGYFVSKSYRKNYEPLDLYMNKLSDNDSLIVINMNEISNKSKIESLKSKGVRIIDFSKVVREAIINKVLVKPLRNIKDNGNKVVYIQFANSSSIKNPSELEKIASTTTIGKIRSEIFNEKYPVGLTSLNASTDYMQQVIAGWKLIPQDAAYDLLEDKHQEFVNVQGGHRIIPSDQNQKSERTIYLFGNSVMYGIGSDDHNTLPSLLSEIIKDNKFEYHVENMANFSMNDYVRGTNLMKSINFKKEDIIIFGSHQPMSEIQQNIFGGEYLNMKQYFDRPHSMGEVYLDMTHLNKNGYRKMADELYNLLVNKSIIDKN